MSTFFEKLFRRKKAQPATGAPEVPPTKAEPVASIEPPTVPSMPLPIATAPLSPDLLPESREQIRPPQLIVGCGQSVGQQREHNEDALFTLTTNMVSDSTLIPFGLYIVADGMGGHQHGEIASGVSIRAMANHILRKIYMPLFNLKAEPPEESVHEILQEGIMESHRAILKDASGGGTTLTACLVMGDQLIIAHVGDSRAYAIYNDGSMRALTRDHSLVKRLEELGQITSAEAAVHPQRNVLYRALGQGEPFEPDINTFPLPTGGYIMLCSDGLWGYVNDQAMMDMIRKAPTPELACHEMVKAANIAGGPDNISVILVRLPE